MGFKIAFYFSLPWDSSPQSAGQDIRPDWPFRLPSPRSPFLFSRPLLYCNTSVSLDFVSCGERCMRRERLVCNLGIQATTAACGHRLYLPFRDITCWLRQRFAQISHHGRWGPGCTNRVHDKDDWRLQRVLEVSQAIDRIANPGEMVASFWSGYIFQTKAVPSPGFEADYGLAIADRLTLQQRVKLSHPFNGRS